MFCAERRIDYPLLQKLKNHNFVDWIILAQLRPNLNGDSRGFRVAMYCFEFRAKREKVISKITHAIRLDSRLPICFPQTPNARARNLEKASATSQDELSRILACTNGKPFCSSERSRIARLCQECRVGSFAATTYIPEYGITPEVRSPLISGNSEFPWESPRISATCSPEIPAKVHLAKHRKDEAKRLLASSKQARLRQKSCFAERGASPCRKGSLNPSINQRRNRLCEFEQCSELKNIV